MKHLKIFEDIKTKPEIGDYVICNEIVDFNQEELENFLNNNIGQYVCLKPSGESFPYLIQYKNIPKELLSNFIKDYNGFSHVRDVNLREIVHKSKNKKDLETYIISNKYNL